MKARIGIDPGASGAIAVITDKDTWATTFEDDSVGRTIAETVNSLRFEGYDVQCVLESVHSFPGQGVASSFKFGRVFGEAIGCLDALEIPYRLVRPQEWQKGIYGLPKKKDGATAHKRFLKQEAQRRFPQCKPTLKTCDALLIADFV